MNEEEMIFEESLSARRAWIEIVHAADEAARQRVALRKESVDRNIHNLNLPSKPIESLSARRAWIEIDVSANESLAEESRSPQGERG